jgi:exosortase A
MAIIPETRPRVAVEWPAWIAAGAALAAAAIVLALLFRHETEGAFHVWMTSTAYNHCFLILPVAGYLAWTRRDAMQRLAPEPDWRALALLVPLSIVWALAALVSILELQQLAVLAMFQAIALSVLGWRAYRAMMLPLLYLFFLVPTGYFLVPYLQDWTAWFAVKGLSLAGIPVYSDGIMIEVPAGQFVVAEACAGLRFLIASVAFGVFFAALTYRSRVRAIIFVGLSIIVPIIANGIRAWGIIAIAEWTNAVRAVEADHIIYGWVFFTAVTLLLIFIGKSFADDHAPAPATLAAAGPYTPTNPARVALAAALGLVLAASGPAYAALRDWRGGGSVSLADATLPAVAAPWVRTDASAIGWKPVIQQPGREFLDAFANGDAVVVRYVALYQVAGFTNDLVRGDNKLADGKRWNAAVSGRAEARIGARNAAVGTAEVDGPARQLEVWDFYIVNGKIVATPLQAKLAQLEGIFERGDNVAAFVALAVDKSGRGNEAAKTLQNFVTAMGPPAAYLRSGEAR